MNGMALFSRTLLVVAAVAMTAGLNQTHADENAEDVDTRSRTLRGAYGLGLTEYCVETPRVPPPAEGYDNETRELLSDANAVVAVVSGTMHFERDGNVTLENATLSDLGLDQTEIGDVPIITGAGLTCEGMHSFAGRTRHLEMELDCTAQFGNVEVTVGPLRFVGFVGRPTHNIILSSVAGNVHTEAIAVDGVPVLERERICLFNGSLARLGNSNAVRDTDFDEPLFE